MDSVTKKLVLGIEGIVESSYQQIEELVSGEFQKYQRQINGYRRKIQATDILLKYLKNGATKLSANDAKIVGRTTYAKKLEEIIHFNKQHKEAKDNAKQLSELSQRVNSLERAKKRLQARYDSQKKKYNKEIESLNKGYKEARFVKDALAELRRMSIMEYEARIGSEEKEKAFIESTYYDGKPTLITYVLEDIIYLIRTRDLIKEKANAYLARIKAILEGKNPDDSKG